MNHFSIDIYFKGNEKFTIRKPTTMPPTIKNIPSQGFIPSSSTLAAMSIQQSWILVSWMLDHYTVLHFGYSYVSVNRIFFLVFVGP
jgi:hypothetical protein